MAQDGPTHAFRVATPPGSKPLLVFDGDCGFCRRWIGRWRGATGDRVDYAPYQEAASRFPEIPRTSFEHAVHLIDTDGGVTSGAEAVFGALARVPGRGGALWAYRRVPGFRGVSERLYRGVAAHRPLLSRLTLLLVGSGREPSRYAISRDLFLRLLGVSYLCAFVSLGTQIRGLVGSEGILPAAPFLDAVSRHYGAERFWLLPTFCWVDASDAFLCFLCWGGAAVSVLVIAGVLTAPALFLAWAGYLSLVVACRVFLNFQWDALLLEAGFLAIFLAPWRSWHRFPCPDPPPRVPLALLRWLLFRLLFSSGVVKLSSGDPTWRSLAALDYHYWTQPLPTWVGWYAHLLPGWFQRASCAAMFAIELAVPFLIFGRRRLRIAAFGSIVGLQALIAVTGNYAFFNLLTASLALLLLDDAAWPSLLRGRLERLPRGGPTARRWRPLAWASVLLAIVIVPASLVEMSGRFRMSLPWTAPIQSLDRALGPFRVVNAYGLFAAMTTERPEIVVEGSNDGSTWLPYAFRWKPGDPARPPRFVAPHQPRLDWQMWFAALGDYRASPWLQGLLERLLEGSPEVLDLLAANPFPAAPPRQVRAILYDYRPADWETHRRTGDWWIRSERGLYCPVRARRDPARERQAGW
ncbi:MAG: lipase maturation factor family protein [Acidobacteriia bacterium]|nr:lipase maturation factor family protein [Terriglobia bacterium]